MKLYASIDFYSETCYAVWTPEMLDEYFRNMKSKGISRIYWIDQKELIMRSGFATHSERMQKSWANFGNDLTGAVPQAAKKHGLEVFALIKPYDLGIMQNAVSEEKRSAPGIDVVGGKIRMYTEFALAHPEAMLQRQVLPAPGQRAVKYVLSFAKPLEHNGFLKVYGSHDNREYALRSIQSVSAGSTGAEVPAGSDEFTVFVLHGCSGANLLRKLVTALDAEGKSVPITFAVCPQKRYRDTHFHLDVYTAQAENDGGFRKQGMIFDYLPGIPSSIHNPEQIENDYVFDFAEAKENALGVTQQLNSSIKGCPDPQNPVYRKFIRDWVEEDLDRGFDGIEIRVSNHNSPLFWQDYGTGRETRIARGNAHTAMLRELSSLTRQAGKKFGIHIPNLMFGSTPDKPSPMEFFWDYRTWIAERVADEVTAKLILADGFSPESIEMLNLCRAQNIPVNYCRFLHGLPEPAEFAARIKAIGVDAFNIYETATVWDGFRDGHFTEKDPRQAASLWKIPEL